jgi:hypothetical protein
MKQLEQKRKRMTMYLGSGLREEYRRAAEMYREETVGYFEQIQGLPVESQGPPDAPWI